MIKKLQKEILMYKRRSLNNQLINYFKKLNLSFPDWMYEVKLSVGNETLPENPFETIYERMASLLIKIALSPKPIGIRKLSKKYNRKKNCGTKKEKIYPASKSYIHELIKILEKQEWVELNLKKGRYISLNGLNHIKKLME